MLAKENRLTGRNNINAVARSGNRLRGRHLVFHVYKAVPESLEQPRFALAVSRRVGNSVTRHRVTRRLRHALSLSIPSVPTGTQILVRAHPQAASATFDQLEADVTRLVKRVRDAA